MRPEILFPLFNSNTKLQGVGQRMAPLLTSIAGPNIIDLLWLNPTGIIDRSFSPTISSAPDGEICTISVEINKHQSPTNKRRPYLVHCSDGTGSIHVIFFNANKEYVRNALPVGETRIISGKIEYFRDQCQMIHPDYILAPEMTNTIQKFEPVYPLTQGLSLKVLLKIIRQSLQYIPTLPEWLDDNFLSEQQWGSWDNCMEALHNPISLKDLEPNAPAKARLAYDELLANQLALALIRQNQKHQNGRQTSKTNVLRSKAIKILPFKLTDDQNIALAEIISDMANKTRMLRLLQGDVGSGKTIVAFLCMLDAIESGHQVALMTPTEILARQHYNTIESYTSHLKLNTTLLTGRDKGIARDKLLTNLKSGKINILIGTHALFQEDVEFNDLAFAVIDEQHRFGVHQRSSFTEKGSGLDLLVMTATPIPRTLAMTTFGDLDISKIKEKPRGRESIITRAIPYERLSEIISAIGRTIETGAKTYWICPLVEESINSDIAAANDRYQMLCNIFGNKVGLIHGRMPADEKDNVICAFRSGNIDILVATTVIEVGVDIPNASIIVIEHAERFGLAQLHQLRGRVGRSNVKSSCILLYRNPLNPIARARLQVIRNTQD